MWGRLSNLVAGSPGGEQHALEAPSGIQVMPSTVVDINDPTDSQVQIMEHERLIIQLKEMVRERENALGAKEAELKKTNAEFSKHKLQTKAKLTSLTQQLEQAQKAASDAIEKASAGSDESVSTLASEMSSTLSEQTSRAKMQLFRKKLKDRDAKLMAKDAELQQKLRELEAKDKIIVERDLAVKSLTEQIAQYSAHSVTIQQAELEKQDVKIDMEAHVQQMYAQMVYKDCKIVELNEQMTLQDKSVIDMQELVNEKEEVIRGRDQAIRILQASISEKETALENQRSLVLQLAVKLECLENELVGYKVHSSQAVPTDPSYSENTARLQSVCEQKDCIISELQSEIQRLRGSLELNRLEVVENHELVRNSQCGVAKIDLGQVETGNELYVGLCGTEQSKTAVSELTKNAEDLVSANSSLKTEIAICRSQTDEQEAKIQDLSESLSEREFTINELKSLVQTKEDEISRYERELKLSSGIVSDREAQIETVLSTSSQSQQQLLNEISYLKEALLKKNESFAELNGLLNNQTELLNESQTKLNDLHCDLEAANKTAKDEKQKSQELLNECSQLQKAVAGYEQNEKQLNTQITDFEIAVKDKGRELEVLREQLDLLRRELVDKDSRIENLVSTLSEKDSSASSSVREVDKLNTVVFELKESLLSKDAEISRCDRTIDEQRVILQEQIDELARCRHQLEEHKTLKVDLMTQLTTACDELNGIKLELTSKQSQLSEASETINQLTNRLKDQDAKVLELSQTIDTLRNDMQQANLELVESLHEKTALLESALADNKLLTSHVELHQSTVADFQASLQDLQSQMLSEQTLYGELKTSYESLEKEFAATKDDLLDKHNVLQTTTIELTSKGEEVATLKESLQSTGSVLAEKETLLDTCNSEISRLNGLLNNQTELLNESQTKLNDLHCDLEAANKTAKDEKQKSQELLNECSQLQKAVAGYEQNEKQLNTQITDFEIAVKDKGRELEVLREQLDLLRRELVDKDSRIENLVSTLSEKDSSASSSVREVDKLNTVVFELKESLLSKDAEISRCDRTIDEQRVILQEQIDELARCRHQLEEHKTLKVDLMTQLTTACDELNGIKLELTSKQSQLSEASETINQLTNRLKDQDAKVLELSQTIDTLRNDMQQANLELVESLHEKTALLESALADNKLLTSHVELHQSTVADFQASLQDLQSQMLSEQTLYGEMKTSYESLEKEFAATKDDLLDKHNVLQTTTIELTSKGEEVAKLKESLQSAGSVLAEKETLLDTCNSEISRLNGLLNNQTELLNESQTKLNDLHCDLEAANKTAKDEKQKSQELLNECSQLQKAVAGYEQNEKQLNTQITDFEIAVKDKGRELEVLREQLDLLRRELVDKDSRIENLVSTLSEKDSSASSSVREVDKLNTVVFELKESLLSKDAEISRCDRTIDEQRVILQEQIDELARCRHQLEEHKTLKVDLMTQLTTACDELNGIKLELTSKQSQLSEASETINQLTNRLKDQDAKVLELSQTIDTLRNDMQQANLELVESLHEKTALLESALADNKLLTSHVELHQSTVADLQASLQDLQSQMLSEQTLYGEMKTSYESLEKEFAATKDDLLDKHNVLQTTTIELTSKGEEVAKLKESLQSAGSVLAEKETLLDTCNSEISRLNGLLNNQTELLNESQTKLNDLHCDLEAANKTAKDEKQKSQELLNECSQLQKAVAGYEQNEKQLNTQITDFEIAVKDKGRELEVLREQLDLLRRELVDKDSRIENLVSTLSEKDSSASSSVREVEIARLVEENTSLRESFVNEAACIELLEQSLSEKNQRLVESSRDLENCESTISQLRIALSETERSGIGVQSAFREIEHELKLQQQETLKFSSKLEDQSIACAEMLDCKVQELERSETKNKELAGKCKQLAAKCKQQITAVLEKDKTIKELEVSLHNMKSDLVMKSSELETIKQECNIVKQELLTSMEVTEREVSTKNDEITSLKDALLKAEELSDQLMSDISMERERFVQSRSLFKLLVQVCEARGIELEHVLYLVKSKTLELSCEDCEFSDMLESMTSVVIEHTKTEELLSTLNSRVQECESDKVKLRESALEHEDEVKHLKCDISMKEAKFDQLHTDFKELASSFDTCQKENNTMQLKLKEIEPLLQEVVEHRNELERNIVNIKQNEEILMKQIENLETTLQIVEDEKQSLLREMDNHYNIAKGKDDTIETTELVLSVDNGIVDCCSKGAEKTLASTLDSSSSVDSTGTQIYFMTVVPSENNAISSSDKHELTNCRMQVEAPQIKEADLYIQTAVLDEKLNVAMKDEVDLIREIQVSDKKVSDLNRLIVLKDNMITAICKCLVSLQEFLLHKSGDASHCWQCFEDLGKLLRNEGCYNAERLQGIGNCEETVTYIDTTLASIIDLMSTQHQVVQSVTKNEKLNVSTASSNLCDEQALVNGVELMPILESKVEVTGELDAKCKELSKKCQQLAAKCKKLMATVSEKDKKIEALQQNLDSAIMRVSEKSEIELVRQQLHVQRDDVTMAAVDTHVVTQEFSTSTNSDTEACSEKDIQINNLTSEIASLKNQIDGLLNQPVSESDSSNIPRSTSRIGLRAVSEQKNLDCLNSQKCVTNESDDTLIVNSQQYEASTSVHLDSLEAEQTLQQDGNTVSVESSAVIHETSNMHVGWECDLLEPDELGEPMNSTEDCTSTSGEFRQVAAATYEQWSGLRCAHCSHPMNLNLVELPNLELRLRQYETEVLQCSRRDSNQYVALLEGLYSLDSELQKIESDYNLSVLLESSSLVPREKHSTLMAAENNEDYIEATQNSGRLDDLPAEISFARSMIVNDNANEKQHTNPCLVVIGDIYERTKSVRSKFESWQWALEMMSSELASLKDRLSVVSSELEERDLELISSKSAFETSELKFEKLKARSISKLKETAATRKILFEQKQLEMEEMKITLSEEITRLQNELSTSQNLCTSSCKRIEELQMLIDNKNEQVIMLTQVSSTINNTDDEQKVSNTNDDVTQSDSGNRSWIRVKTVDTGCQSCCDIEEVGQYKRLEACLVAANTALQSIADSDSCKLIDFGGNFEEEFSSYVEKCTQFVSGLRSELQEKEVKLLTAIEEITKKDILSKKYANAARKLKQQLQETRMQASLNENMDEKFKQCECELQQCSSDLLKVKTESAEKDAQLRLFEHVLEEKDVKITSLMNEISGLSEATAKQTQEEIRRQLELEELRRNVHEQCDFIEQKCLELGMENHEGLLSDCQSCIDVLKLRVEHVVNKLEKINRQHSNLQKNYDQLVLQQDDMHKSMYEQQNEFATAEGAWKHELAVLKSEMLVQQDSYNKKLSDLEMSDPDKTIQEGMLLQKAEDLETLVCHLRNAILEKDALLSEQANSLIDFESNTASLTDCVSLLKQELDDSKIDCEELRSTLSDKESFIVKLCECSEKSESQVNKFKSVIKKLKIQLEEMKSGSVLAAEQINQLKHSEERLSMLSAQLSDVQSLLAAEEDRLAAAETCIAEQNELLQQKDSIISETNDLLMRERSGVLAHHSYTEGVLKEFADFKRDYANLQNTLESVNDQLERTIDSNRQLSMQFSLSSETKATLEQQLSEKDFQLKDYLMLNEKCDKQTLDIEQYMQQIGSLKDKLDSYENLIQDCDAKITHLVAENEDLKKGLSCEVISSNNSLCAVNTVAEPSGWEFGDNEVIEEIISQKLLSTAINQDAAYMQQVVSSDDISGIDSVSPRAGATAELSSITVDSSFGLDILGSQLKTLFSEDNEIHLRREEMQSQLDSLVSKSISLEKDKKELLCENSQLKSRLADVEVEVCSLKRELTSVTFEGATNVIVTNSSKYEAPLQSTESYVPSQHRELPEQLMDVKMESNLVQGTSNTESAVFQQLQDLKQYCAALELERSAALQQLNYEKDKSVSYAAMEKRKNALEEENKNFSKQVEMFTSTKEKMLVKMKQLKTSNEQLRLQIDSMQRELTDATNALAQIESDKKHSISEIDYIRGELIMKTNTLAELESDKKQCTALAHSLQCERDDALNKFAQILSEQEQYVAENEMQKDRVVKSEMQVKDLYAQLEATRQEMLNLEQSYKTSLFPLQAQIDNLELTVVQQAKSLHSKQVEIDGLIIEKQSMESSLGSKVSHYEQQLAEVILEKNQLAQLVEQVKLESTANEESSMRKLADLQLLHNSLLVDSESFQEMVQHLTAEKSRLEKIVQDNGLSAEQLKNDMEALRDENEDLLAVKQDMEIKLQNIERETQETTSKITDISLSTTDLESELDFAQRINVSLKEEIDGLNWRIQELSEAEEEMQQIQSELFQVQSENGMLKKKLNALEKECGHLQHEQTKQTEECLRLNAEKTQLITDVQQLKFELNTLSSELLILKEIHKECSALTRVTDIGVDVMTQCSDEEMDCASKTQLLIASGELCLVKAESSHLHASLSNLHMGFESLQRNASVGEHAHSEIAVRPVLVDQWVQTGDTQSLRRPFTSSRKRELSHFAATGHSLADRSVIDSADTETWTSVPIGSFEYTPIHSSNSVPSSRLDGVVVSSSSEAQLQRNLFIEQKKRMELEETLNLLLQQQEHQETEQYKLEEARTETRSSRTEHVIAVESDTEGDENQVFVPKTLLSRQIVCWLRRLKHRIGVDSVGISHMLRARVRIRAIFVLYIVALHFYILFGCLLS